MLSEIAAALAPHGLISRGGVTLDDAALRSVLLVGNAGASYWPRFSRWWREQPEDLANPLDTWSRTVIGEVAEKFGARVVMPNDRPFAPFQQWAMRAEGLRPSPLGLLIHPVHGLWHAYRGALAFDVEIPIQGAGEVIHPCDLCIGKPCLNACPVDAFSAAGFVYEACVEHVRSPHGARCRERGCLARNACPVGVDYRYPAEVQAFHQKAFAGL